MLLFSLAFGELAPAFGSGQISAQAYTTADWSNWAATAWAYYLPGVGVSSSTGLHRANLGWPCFTDWDLGSYIYSIIHARKLGLITDSNATDSWQFGDRINKVLTFLKNRPLGPSGIPFNSYRYDAINPYQACSTAFTNAADSGRLLAALYALKVFSPTYSSRVDAIYALTKDSYNSMATNLGSDYYGYMAAEGFAAFGADESAVFSVIDNYPATGSFVPVYGQSLPTMRTLSEPFIHAILEPSLVHAPTPRFLDFADRTYRAQYGRFSGTSPNKLTAWSEGGSAYGYIYEWIVYTPNPNSPDQPQTWVIQASTGSILNPNATYPLIPLAYAKVAFAYLAIYGENAYTLALVNAAKNLANPSQGFSDANLEDGTIPNYGYSDKTNELVLAAASRVLSLPQLTVSAGSGGTTTPSPGTYPHYAGDTISVSYSITSSGYTFAGWTVSGASCNGGSMSNPCAFSMPSNAVSVTANFNPPNQYQLTVSAGSGGTTTPSPGTYPHYAGDTISVSYSITSSGYTFGGWSVSPASCNGGSMSNPCAFTMPSNAVSVYASFSQFSPPAAPVLVSPVNGASGVSLTPTLTWQAVSGVDGYQVAVYDTVSSSWFLIVWTTGTSYSVPAGKLVSGRLYMWAVWAHNAAGFGPASAWVFNTYVVPAAPVLVSPVNGASGVSLTPTLTWQAVSGVDGYQVAVYDTVSSSWFLIVWTTGTSYSVPAGKLVSGRLYMWAVWAHNAAGFGPASARFFNT